MLQSIKQIYGDKLVAFDGDIGHVKDFYFDDENWVVRYLVADTGSWLTGRQVLLAPHAFGNLNVDEKIIHIMLHKKKIQESPSIDSHQPVSRHYEAEYFAYYGWPTYWEGNGLWGMGSYPVILQYLKMGPQTQKTYHLRFDKHLRSMKAVTGYGIQTVDGEIGNVSSFLVDDKSWAIQELIVETGHWYAGKEIFIPTDTVKKISYGESKVFVSLTKEDIQQTAENQISHHMKGLVKI